MTFQAQGPKRAGSPDQLPDDIELDEASRNWVTRQSEVDPQRPLRRLAADAAVTAAIGQAYGAD